MSVYVDELFRTPRSDRWPFAAACHLLADDVDELHAFARAIGLRRSWFQNRAGQTPHYDLNPRRREAAVAHGAIQLARRAAVEKVRELREAAARSEAAKRRRIEATRAQGSA